LRHGGWSINNREHFYAITAICMRRVLVDLARARLTQSRGSGHIPISLEDVQSVETSGNGNLQQIVEIGQLMERLEKKDRVAALIV
jgi:ECF sigma factor